MIGKTFLYASHRFVGRLKMNICFKLFKQMCWQLHPVSWMYSATFKLWLSRLTNCALWFLTDIRCWRSDTCPVITAALSNIVTPSRPGAIIEVSSRITSLEATRKRQTLFFSHGTTGVCDSVVTSTHAWRPGVMVSTSHWGGIQI